MSVTVQRCLNSARQGPSIYLSGLDPFDMSDSGRDSDADFPSLHRMQKRVSKPLMEKRRRERINSSLEALRLLMVENTDNEKLKNPKVEKAEILETVVAFLQTERGQQAMRRSMLAEPMPNCAQQQSYHNGMRSCMLRVNHFMRQDVKENSGPHGNQVPFGLPGPQAPFNPPELFRGPPMAAPQHLLHHQLSHPYLGRVHFSPQELQPSPVVPALNDGVWRPWPK
ncbi:unnamed protein product [Ophioblennius macclurei]